MKELADLYPQLGVAGGGGLVAAYLVHMVVRFQRDFTNRYAVELHRALEERDRERERAEAERQRANRYAVELARNGISIPADVAPPSTLEA